MVPYQRGGIPKILTGTATTTPANWAWGGGIANKIYFLNLDLANDITIYFSEADKDAGIGLLIPAIIGTPGNPFIMDLELSDLWVVSSAGTAAFQAVLALRRG